ncbi:MAG: hypothetical protein A3C90_02740 [Candidatus Magasanikbacteria bacterium RIFCSPHIGHO2_02_FULL_51_14]|uniref:Uncharacterized protein n=1 Tax=Candidatus Magasanikbacteria bacterium RIFCSPHIGHO2_02_FULL_51_14 TaxID=1798683 RepID=A0A1F6MQW6_9BACT|nr:MAG: hypothetical protein A3C90_02740 [Candidatus Magasanikbacteria bacterium RIFCSPHIGHO2_02_FULL_51_14]
MDKIAVKTIRTATLGREPVVLVPLKRWKKIENSLEDLDMFLSRTVRRDIARARGEVRKGRTVSFDAAMRKIGISS